MIARPDALHRLTVRELCELIFQYVEHNGLSLDASVEAVVFDTSVPDAETSYPATTLACHVGKGKLYLYAANTGDSDE